MSAKTSLQRFRPLLCLRRVDVLVPVLASCWRVLNGRFTPPPHGPSLSLVAAPAHAHEELNARTQPTLRLWWDALLLMAAPKKRTSYTRKRVRQAGQIAMRAPKLKPHLSMCPVCERMRAPHRVCEREDCKTYFKHRWL
uniref:Large ribosomal subunit protein bL32m n=1 Tax=Calcidiscus leptoporus TaxID=127549 RepID=A0A7S0J1V0_9EUKA